MAQFVESIQNFSIQFETLRMRRDLNGRMLMTQVRRKLPEEHRVQLLQSVSEGEATYSMLCLVKWLRSLLVLLQKAKSPLA